MKISKRNGMNTLVNNYDAIEKLILEENLKIVSVDFHAELDLMLVLLNTKAVLHQKLSAYPALKNADKKSLSDFEIIADRKGIHWSLLDEDLSLKGFLQDELRSAVTPANRSEIL